MIGIHDKMVEFLAITSFFLHCFFLWNDQYNSAKWNYILKWLLSCMTNTHNSLHHRLTGFAQASRVIWWPLFVLYQFELVQGSARRVVSSQIIVKVHQQVRGHDGPLRQHNSQITVRHRTAHYNTTQFYAEICESSAAFALSLSSISLGKCSIFTRAHLQFCMFSEWLTHMSDHNDKCWTGRLSLFLNIFIFQDTFLADTANRLGSNCRIKGKKLKYSLLWWLKTKK